MCGAGGRRSRAELARGLKPQGGPHGLHLARWLAAARS
jgi:hypothetical protein